MAQIILPIINDQLFHVAQMNIAYKNVVIPYTCEPDSVGIAIQENSLGIYRIYCTNEHGALDWEKPYYDFAQALSFAQEFYVCYKKLLYSSNVLDLSVKRSLKVAARSDRNFTGLSNPNANQYQIVGKNELRGEVSIGGSVHAGLAILAATLLVNGPCRIENLSTPGDIQQFFAILTKMGATVQTTDETTFEINCSTVRTTSVPFELASRFWASCYLVGAMLGRFGEVKIPLSSDSNFYARSINPHIRGVTMLGATVNVYGGYIHAQTTSNCGLEGASITLDSPSEDVTVNIMLAGTLAHGRTVIQNAARDPSIVDLANFLNSMGADIKGAGTSMIKIRGVEKLTGGSYSVIPDWIEAGTYMAAVAATGGSVVIQNVIPAHLRSISYNLQRMGAKITNLSDAVLIDSYERLRSIYLHTVPYPGFPIDMQPQLVACMSIAYGTSVVTDSITETGFPYMEELKRFGVSAQVDREKAVIEGVETIYGCPAYVDDPYTCAAIVIAGLVAEGTTVISGIHRIKRRYRNMAEKLTKVGANIKEVNDTDTLEQRITKTS